MAKTVLIVDDSATARMLIRRCVEIAGIPDANFLDASHGREALEVLGAQKVDLIFTDLNMPEMDGLDFLRSARALEGYATTPIVIITSAGNEAKESILRREGASFILSKPISPAVIATTLQKLEILGDE